MKGAGEKLFSYGTLRDAKVQRAVFGRIVDGVGDAVIGYRLASINVSEERTVALSGLNVHHILDPTGQDGDLVEGVVLHITLKELSLADAYEPAGYKRVEARLRSGGNAWVYVRA